MLLYLQTWAFQSYNVYLLLQMPVGFFNVLILEVLCILLTIISVRITHTYFTVHDIVHSYFLIVFQEIQLIYFGCKIYCGNLVAYWADYCPILKSYVHDKTYILSYSHWVLPEMLFGITRSHCFFSEEYNSFLLFLSSCSI